MAEDRAFESRRNHQGGKNRNRIRGPFASRVALGMGPRRVAQANVHAICSHADPTGSAALQWQQPQAFQRQAHRVRRRWTSGWHPTLLRTIIPLSVGNGSYPREFSCAGQRYFTLLPGMKESCGVLDLALFGSVARDEERADSDVDALVESLEEFCVLSNKTYCLKNIIAEFKSETRLKTM